MTEAGKAFEYMAQNGWKTDEMLNGIDGVMNLAAASGEDLAGTADTVTVSLSALKMKASDAGHFADVLARTSADTATNVKMLGESFKYAAPLAGALGYSCEDVSVALGLMANAGIRSSQSGTALRSLLTNMAKPTKQMKGAMDKLGVSLTDGSGKAKSLHQIMLDLRSGFSKLSESEKVATAGALAGKYGMSGLLAIVNTSDDDFNKLTNSINNCEGAAKEMAQTKLDNLQGQLKILKSSVESLGIEFYESVGNPLTNVVKQGIEMVNSLTKAFKAGGLEGMVVKLGDVLGTIVTQFANFLPQFIDVGIEVVNNLINGLSSNSDQLASSGVKIIKSLINGIKTLVPKVIDLGADIAKSLLKSLTGENFDNEINNFAKTIKNVLGNAFKVAGDLLKPFLKLATELLGCLDTLGPAILGVVTAFKAYQIACNLAKDAQVLFNAVSSANKFVILASAIIGVAAALGALSFTTSEVDTKHKDLIDKVNEECQSYKDLQKQAEESMKKGFSDTSYIESLKGELNGLVDANGKVKEGYKGRVDFICKELQEATGIEIKQVDGVIQKYGELSKQIDENIRKKKADIVMEALKPQYEDAIKNRVSNMKDLVNLEDKLKEEQEELDNMTSTFGNPKYDLGDIKDQKKKIEETKSAINDLNGTIKDSENDIKNYEAMTELSAKGSYDAIYQMYAEFATGMKNGADMSEDEAQDTLSKLRRMYDEANSLGYTDTANLIKKSIASKIDEMSPDVRQKMIDLGYTSGLDLGDSTANGINASSPNVENAINGLSNNYVVLANSSINASNQIIGKNGEVIGSLQNVTQNADGTRNGIANLNGTPINIKVHENGVISTLDGVLNKCREISGSAVTVEMRQRWTSNGKGGVYVPEGYATGTNNATRGVHLVGEEGPELVMFNGGESVLNTSKTKSVYENLKNQIGKLMIESPDIISNFVNGISSHIDNFAKSITVNGTIKIDSINSQLSAILSEDSINKLGKAVENGASNSTPTVNMDSKKVSKAISPYMSTDLAFSFNGRR